MRGILLLCDYAEELNGKLYIMGGGWSQYTPQAPTASMALAIKLVFPWTDAKRRHGITVKLVDSDGQAAVMQDGQPIAINGQLEVGGRPGLIEGTELDVPLVFRLEGLKLDVGRYIWEVLIDDEPVQSATATFEVLPSKWSHELTTPAGDS
jgi:hypothetical protein